MEPLVALSNIVPPVVDDEIDNSLISQNTKQKITAPVSPGKLRKTASASFTSSEDKDSTQDQPPFQPQRNLHTEKPGCQNLSIPENAITLQMLGQVQQRKSPSVAMNKGDDLVSLQSLDGSDADNKRNGNEDAQDADSNKNILRRSRRLYTLSIEEDRTSATPKPSVIKNQECRIASTSSAQGTRDGGDLQKYKQQIVKTCCTLGAKVKKLSQQLTLETIALCEKELKAQANATNTKL